MSEPDNQLRNQDLDLQFDLDRNFIKIDANRLSNETLLNLAREFVLRETGQEHAQITDIEHSSTMAVSKMKSGSIVITYDSRTETVGAIPLETWKSLESRGNQFSNTQDRN